MCVEGYVVNTENDLIENVIIDGRLDAPITFFFAHGAGAGMGHEFMDDVAKGLASEMVKVIRFNFPYMNRKQREGRNFPPDRLPKLLVTYQAYIDRYASRINVIGGKSMGGRVASHLTAHDRVSGVICLGFPFHPSGKPEKFKGEHLSCIEKPTLILQGERDMFGKPDEITSYALSSLVKVTFIPDGDHSFKPRKSSGFTHDENIKQVCSFITEFLHERLNLAV